MKNSRFCCVYVKVVASRKQWRISPGARRFTRKCTRTLLRSCCVVDGEEASVCLELEIMKFTMASLNQTETCRETRAWEVYHELCCGSLVNENGKCAYTRAYTDAWMYVLFVCAACCIRRAHPNGTT